jgi:23S rRNA (guanosine2251-2'-O)-methyltransferase
MTVFLFKTIFTMAFERREKQEKNEQLIFGFHAVEEALINGKTIDKILLERGTDAKKIIDLAKKNEVYYQFVPQEWFFKIKSKNHQGVAAFVSNVEYYDFKNVIIDIFDAGKVPLILILDRITDVRNFGAIARTAECAGVDLIIVPQQGSAMLNGDAIKTSAGALHRIKVSKEANIKDVMLYLQQSGIKVVACTEKTDTTIYNTDLTQPVAIMMGNEDEGISQEYLKRCDFKAMIPMQGTINSLNVGIATGIILFEALKQRNN